MRNALRLAALAASLALSAPYARAEEPASGVAFEGVNLPFADVQAKAKAAAKPIFVDFFTDWCGWCKKLDAEVFSQQAFKDYAAKNLVLVEVDFPRSFQLPEPTKKQNDELAKKFKIQGYPTIVITTASGTKRGEVGYVPGGPEAFIKELKKND